MNAEVLLVIFGTLQRADHGHQDLDLDSAAQWSWAERPMRFFARGQSISPERRPAFASFHHATTKGQRIQVIQIPDAKGISCQYERQPMTGAAFGWT